MAEQKTKEAKQKTSKPNKANTKKCPFCAEDIKVDAKKCIHCEKWLEQQKTETTKEDYKKTSKVPVWAWILIILFFLIIGGCLYFGSETSKQTSKNINQEVKAKEEIKEKTKTVEGAEILDERIEGNVYITNYYVPTATTQKDIEEFAKNISMIRQERGDTHVILRFFDDKQIGSQYYEIDWVSLSPEESDETNSHFIGYYIYNSINGIEEYKDPR